MKKPTFFILGAAKCGTTLLYDLLNQHPEICMSEPKEPLFFEAEYNKGLNYYWNKYFANWKEEKIVGEARHRNLYLPYVAERIKESAPDAKLIVIIRNPVDRAYSHWWFWYSYGLEKLSFEDAIYKDVNRIKKGITFEGNDGPCLWERKLDFRYGINEFRTYLDSGYYSQQIQRYLKLFPVKQLKIIYFEDLARNTIQVISELCLFLGVDPNYEIVDGHVRHNTAMSSLAIQIKQMLKYLGVRKVTKYLPCKVVNLKLNLLSKVGSKENINPFTRNKLIKHYQNYNEDLEKLAGRDLSHWNV